MSRIVNPDSAGKQRGQLVRAVALALRELSQQAEYGVDARDQAAFIAIALQTIADGIDSSVAAWEKRGYWVKADRFRMDWGWAGQFSEKMRAAVLSDEAASVAALGAQIAGKLGKVQVPPRHRLG